MFLLDFGFYSDEAPSLFYVLGAYRIHAAWIDEFVIFHPSFERPITACCNYGDFVHTDGFFANETNFIFGNLKAKAAATKSTTTTSETSSSTKPAAPKHSLLWSKINQNFRWINCSSDLLKDIVGNFANCRRRGEWDQHAELIDVPRETRAKD